MFSRFPSSLPYSGNSTGNIGRIGRHRAENPDVKVTMSFGPMPPDASDFPGGIPAYLLPCVSCLLFICLRLRLLPHPSPFYPPVSTFCSFTAPSPAPVLRIVGMIMQQCSCTVPDHPATRPPDHPTTRPPDHPTTRPPDHPTTRPEKLKGMWPGAFTSTPLSLRVVLAALLVKGPSVKKKGLLKWSTMAELKRGNDEQTVRASVACSARRRLASSPQMKIHAPLALPSTRIPRQDVSLINLPFVHFRREEKYTEDKSFHGFMNRMCAVCH